MPRLAVAVAIVGMLAGCDAVEPEPEARTAELRIAHLAVGAGPVDIIVNDEVLVTDLQHSAVIEHPVAEGDQTVVVDPASGAPVTLVVPTTDVLTAVVFSNGAAPEMHAFEHSGVGAGSELVVVNAAPGSTLNFILMPATDGETMQGVVGYGEAEPASGASGTYYLDVIEGNDGERIPFGTVEVPAGASFLVLYPHPNPTPADPFLYTLFQ